MEFNKAKSLSNTTPFPRTDLIDSKLLTVIGVSTSLTLSGVCERIRRVSSPKKSTILAAFSLPIPSIFSLK